MLILDAYQIVQQMVFAPWRKVMGFKLWHYFSTYIDKCICKDHYYGSACKVISGKFLANLQNATNSLYLSTS